MSRASFWEIKKQMPAAVVGSSLGALVALDAARIALHAPLLLLAPALGFGSRWIERLPPGDPIPFVHHGEQREIAIHRRFFEQLARVDADRDPPDVPVVVIMGRHDESVPFDLVRGVWNRWEMSGRLAAGSRFVEIADGDHSLIEHVGRIAEEIERSIDAYSASGPT
jgi:pimeloyl-ACP methyl ester carboxylesterase